MAFVAGVAGVCIAGACLSRYINDDSAPRVEVFVADWCPHCRKIKDEINKLVKDQDGYTVKVYVDGTVEATEMQEKRDITSFPTILLTRGDSVTPYTGPRNYEGVKGAITQS